MICGFFEIKIYQIIQAIAPIYRGGKSGHQPMLGIDYAQWVTPTGCIAKCSQGKRHRDDTTQFFFKKKWEKVKSFLVYKFSLYQLISETKYYKSSSLVTMKDGKPCVVKGRVLISSVGELGSAARIYW